ncbi:hypothetical protein D3C78_1698420 [compost metagenome]
MLHPADQPRAALTQYCQARAAVFATFVVVRGGAQQVEREGVLTLQADLMEVLDRRTEPLGVEAHIIA